MDLNLNEYAGSAHGVENDCKEDLYHNSERDKCSLLIEHASSSHSEQHVSDSDHDSTNDASKKHRQLEAVQNNLAIAPTSDLAFIDLITEQNCSCTSPATQERPIMVPLKNEECSLQQKDKGQRPVYLFKPCFYFSTGRTCKQGKHCRFLHDEEVRDNNMEKEKRRAERGSRKAESVMASLKSDVMDLQFAILVCGYGDAYEDGSPEVTSRFHRFKPSRVKWSSQFSLEERQKLQDSYSLPEKFFMMSFSSSEDQRNAITQRNRKQAGFSGPKLLVQQCFPKRELPARNSNENNVEFKL